jgi:hypothetical protein
MDISKYTKAVVSVAGGLLSFVTVLITLADLLPSDLQWVTALVTTLVGFSSAITAFLVWLARNEPAIEQDAAAIGEVAKDVKTLIDHAKDVKDWRSDVNALLHSPLNLLTDAKRIGEELAALPEAVKKVVAEAKSQPVQAASDAIAVAHEITDAAADAVSAVQSAGAQPSAGVVETAADIAASAVQVAASVAPAPVVQAVETAVAPVTAIAQKVEAAAAPVVSVVEQVAGPVLNSVEDILKANPIR